VPLATLMTNPTQTQRNNPIIDPIASCFANPSKRRSISMIAPTRNASPM